MELAIDASWVAGGSLRIKKSGKHSGTRAEQQLSAGVGIFMCLKMNGKISLCLVKRGEEFVV